MNTRNRDHHCKSHSRQWNFGIRFSFWGEKYVGFIYTHLHQENNQLQGLNIMYQYLQQFWDLKACPLGISGYYLKVVFIFV